MKKIYVDYAYIGFVRKTGRTYRAKHVGWFEPMKRTFRTEAGAVRALIRFDKQARAQRLVH